MEIEQIGNTFNTKKFKKYYPILIIIVAVIGLYTYYKNKNNSTYTGITTSSDQTNIGSGQDIAAITDSLNSQYSSQFQQVQQQIQNIVEEQKQYENTMTANLTSLGETLNQQQQQYAEALNQNISSAVNALNRQQQEQFKVLETQFGTGLTDITNTLTQNLNETLKNSLSNITGQSVTNYHNTDTTGTRPSLSPLENEINYLENLRKSSADAGTRSWANQTQYLLNLATQTTDIGTKNWAINQLTSKQGLTQQQLSKLGVK